MILTKNTLYGAVDPNSLRPLVIGKTENDTYVMASETCAIDNIGVEFLCNVKAGQLAIIDKDGLKIENYTTPE